MTVLDLPMPFLIKPINLLPVLSKLAEKVILARLNDHLERENILIPEQHGFRPRLSTSHQLLRVVEFIKEGNNKDECTAAVFLDIQKAFDRKQYYHKKLQVLPKLEIKDLYIQDLIKDLDAQEKRNEKKVIDELISIIVSLIEEFSTRFSQFKELLKTFKFIMYPDVISFDKLNLSRFDWLEIAEFEMQLIDFQSFNKDSKVY
ncbi:uncharacterized protein TNCV_3028401 [Trichonephila clavipes]|nr:uncharacterized protein TNCV_3028401 [Trichonephila clavipes]